MKTAAFTLSILALLAPPLAAEEPAEGRLTVELNAVGSQDGGCALTFLVQNGHADAIGSVVFETVLFDISGQVDRLTLFDFRDLPAGRPRVRQFVVPDLACEDLGRVLFNGAETCTVSGAESGLCTDTLRLSTRTDVEVIG